MSRKLAGLALAGVILGSAAALIALKPAAPLPPGTSYSTGRALIGGPFTLVDQTGKTVTEKDFLGRYMLVFFGFTHCPDICPSGLQVMTAALDKLGARADAITPVFISFDSARDTPQTMAQYAKSFHPRLVALTGTEAQVAAAAKAYRVYYQKVADAQDATQYTYDHTAIFYLMDKDGNLLVPIQHTTDVEKLRAAIDKALPQHTP